MYCWDEVKRDSNLKKHGIPFDVAPILFASRIFEVEDFRFDYGEVRRNAYGYVNGRLFVCTYVERFGWRHIISLRKCNRRETRLYGQTDT